MRQCKEIFSFLFCYLYLNENETNSTESTTQCFLKLLNLMICMETAICTDRDKKYMEKSEQLHIVVETIACNMRICDSVEF